MPDKKKICIVATVPVALRVFMLEHIRELSVFYDVTLMANAEPSEMESTFSDNVKFIPLPIKRKVSLLSDVLSLFNLYNLFRRERFDCVFSIMPKSGLLSMVAAFFARIPHRIHMFTGQVWFTKTGVVRAGLKFLDKILVWSATSVLADSPSQRQFLIDNRIVRSEKISVLGKGSISGVDVNRFKPDALARKKYRKDLGVADDAVVFLFMARLTHVKGILELSRAFSQVAAQMPRAHLLVIGPDEDGIEGDLQKELESCKSRVHRVGYTYNPEGYMAAADVFCIPSYREGFSLATIQAAGVGLPAIASNIYGLSDAVQKDQTGIFHEPGNVGAMAAALQCLYLDEELRARLSAQAYQRAHSEFAQQVIVAEMVAFVRKRLH
ncbi:glycosyltransferase family 4 protein [Pseudomonas sp. 148P]|uniref:Glycosyltransferase family 4 protein n=1 Tax=Pseudomonas ulcerans TaxID=3115852 RepID=A0ABU7HYW2_9PSED|nr:MULTISPECIES: glycosyltransferase family 4 protein [unclassified Pseudomonas]MEE1922832.1 glycosyltransferase family 4 protein [Pseudomonas sp. 147P]MEE1936732.1 glycosyltransferase family 4 protein [Pseudomonas sp. 148P]